LTVRRSEEGARITSQRCELESLFGDERPKELVRSDANVVTSALKPGSQSDEGLDVAA
jgi:hypothetical protein